MGSGIAIAALEAGLQVCLVEQDAAALARGVERIEAHLSGRVAAGRLAADAAARTRALLQATVDWAVLREADLVIEAVFEDLAVKQKVFRRIDEVPRPGAVLATNTSYLDLDAIAAATSRPQDVIGLHFLSPANVMKLVEVVHGRSSVIPAQAGIHVSGRVDSRLRGNDGGRGVSSGAALATGLAVAKRMKKLPVLAGNAFGFIGNRIYSAYRRQCEFMVEEGAWPEQVDAALQAFGFAMGPFAVADLSGLDIAWRMRQAQSGQRDPAARSGPGFVRGEVRHLLAA